MCHFQLFLLVFEPCQSQIFSHGYIDEAENAAESEDFNNKTLLSNQEIDVFLLKSKETQLVKRANSDVSKFVEFMQEPHLSGERSLNESPPTELNNYFCHINLETHSEECEPNSLTISET